MTSQLPVYMGMKFPSGKYADCLKYGVNLLFDSKYIYVNGDLKGLSG